MICVYWYLHLNGTLVDCKERQWPSLAKARCSTAAVKLPLPQANAQHLIFILFQPTLPHAHAHAHAQDDADTDMLILMPMLMLMLILKLNMMLMLLLMQVLMPMLMLELK